MNRETEKDQSSRELAKRLADWRAEAERWVEETCQRAVTRLKSVMVEEIRALSRRVERAHELLDQLEQMVESPREGQGEAPPSARREEASEASSRPSSEGQQ